MKSFFDTIFTRVSMRTFLPTPIATEEVDQLLRSAMAGPTASNKQPWDFVIIRNRAVLDFLASELPYAKMAALAPLGIVVCAAPERAYEGSKDYAIVDTSIACTHLILAAEAMGLGAVWTALFPQVEREATVRQVLAIPENVVPLSFVLIGRPRMRLKAKEKYQEANIHCEQW